MQLHTSCTMFHAAAHCTVETAGSAHAAAHRTVETADSAHAVRLHMLMQLHACSPANDIDLRKQISSPTIVKHRNNKEVQ